MIKILKIALNSLPVAIEILIGLALFSLPISKAAAETFFIIAMAFWILKKIHTKTPLLPPFRLIFLYILFLGSTLISLTQIPHPLFSTGLRGIFKWFKYFGIFFMCWDVYSSSQKQLRLFWILLISMCVVTLDGFWQLHSGKDIFFGYTLDPGRITRMKACLSAPTLLASFLLFAVPLSALLFFKSRSWRRVLSASVFVLFVVAFFLTYSRGAFYALVISLLLNLILLKKIKHAIVSAACLILLVLAIPSFRYNFIKTMESKDITIVEREEYWKVAFNMIKKHPLLGVGVNTYHSRFPDYVTTPKVNRAYPHNSYLQMTSEIGIPGALLFVSALAVTLWRSIKFRTDSVMVTLRIALIAFLIKSFFDTDLYSLQLAALFWLFWGIFSSLVYSQTYDLMSNPKTIHRTPL